MKDARSRRAYADACACIPGGVNSPVRAFTQLGRTPLFIKKASGARITDVDNNAYIDYCLSWGVHILGHNHAGINTAVRAALNNGASYGAPTIHETGLARQIIAAVPSIEKIRFVNSGTEASMSAVRLARAYTRRDIVVKFDGCYHGHADHLLVAGGSGLSALARSSSAGVPQASVAATISIPFNDARAVGRVFKKHGGRIAAVIVEPVPANMGVILPDDGFLAFLRQVTERHGALLIFDEVITGFRFHRGGAQGYFGVTPDLTILGKIIGGGFPVGAFGGRRAVMDLLAPLGPVYQAGTLSGNPLAMAAGSAVLERLSKKGFYETLNRTADDFTRDLRAAGKQRGFTVNAVGPMFSLFFSKNVIRDYAGLKTCDTVRFARSYQRLLAAGIYLSPSQGEAHFISARHDQKKLQLTVRGIANRTR